MVHRYLIPIVFLLIYTGLYGQDTITIYPDKDALVNTVYSDSNFAASETFESYLYNGKLAERHRSFIEFDLSAIPAGSTIISAKLMLFGINHSGQNDSYLIRVKDPWSEDALTWNNQPETQKGDWIILPQSSTNDQNYLLDATSFVQNWINGTYPNHGFMLRIANVLLLQTNALIFGSSDHPDVSKHPKLEITYIPPTPPLTITYTSTDPTCEGSNTGAIDITVTGGETPYSYQWSNDDTIEDIHNLYSGIYLVTVTDNSGDFAFEAFQINEPLPAQAEPNDPQPCSDIFISEYIEGSQQNKVLELYNPTEEQIWLNRYFVRVFINGAPTPLITQLIGTILPGETFVIANPNSDNNVILIADQTSNKLNFNGDDAIQIVKVLNEVPDYDFNGVGGNPHEILNALELDTIDQLGLPYLDPGNQGFPVGNATTKDNTLRRNPNVTHGTQDWDCGQMQWNAAAGGNDFSNLKQHTNSCKSLDENIYYSFANPYEKDSSDNKRYFHFDILMHGDHDTAYFSASYIFLSYNADAFGSNAASKVDLSLSQELINSVTYWKNLVINADTNTIRIFVAVIGSLSSPNRVNITSTPKKFFHVSFEIDSNSCSNNTEIQFDTTLNDATLFNYSQTAPEGSGGNQTYDNTFYEDSIDLTLCKMNILSFTPKVYPGTYYPGTTDNKWEMVITGTNFGETRGNGNVWFPDAHSGGVKTVLTNGYNLSWTDTEIRIKMATIVDTSLYEIGGILDRRITGSGNFYIINDMGDSVMSDSPVEMPYAIANEMTYFQTNRMDLVNLIDDTTGYVFQFSQSLLNYPDTMARVVAERAINEWACQVGVNFSIDSVPSAETGSAIDNVNLIYMVNSFPNAPMAAGLTSFNNRNCLNTYGERIFFPTDIDIGFVYDPGVLPGQNGLTAWHIDTAGSDLPPYHYDFYEAALHEVGHACMIEHVINSESLMNYTIRLNQTDTVAWHDRFDIQANDVYAGEDVIEKSLLSEFDPYDCSNAAAGASKINYLTIPGCATTNSIESVTNNEDFRVIIYPNPIGNDGFYISYEVDHISFVEISIFDINGRLLQQSGKKQTKGEHIDFVESGNITQGMYFAVIKIDDISTTYKLIKY